MLQSVRLTARYRQLIVLCRDSLFGEKSENLLDSLADRIKLKLMESVTDLGKSASAAA